jgi:transglutaminase-like putative cysteine protease
MRRRQNNLPIDGFMRILLSFGFLLIMAGTVSVLAGNDQVEWRPVSPAELQMKAPLVEPGADAEAIFWEIKLDDKKYGKLSYSHYVRVKIFTERGRERFSKMDIPFSKGKKVENVAARVIKPDGTIVELQPSDIFEREIATANKIRIKAKSFAVPGIEPGVIVEYQYTETFKGDSAGGERLVFQRDIPLQKVTYYVRPYSNSTLTFHSYNMPETNFAKDKDGYSVATLYNVPAYKNEPYMPPADEVRKWVYLTYQSWGSIFQWSFLSYAWDEALKKLSKPNKEVKEKAAELTTGAQSDEEKLKRIFEFVRKNIKNLSYDRTLSEEEVEKLDIKDADDALKRGMGRSGQIDMLFASLARAAGLETAIVLAGDRSENFFNTEKYPFPNFVEWSAIAIKINGQWKYFDPCIPFLPFGALTWNREDVKAMVITDGGYTWSTIPLSDATRSSARRSGKFTLSADGTLEGTVRLEYDGQQAISRRREEFRDSDSKREQNIVDEIKSHMSTAEIRNLTIENFEDISKPLTYVFKVKVPNYAQRVGKRMILQPGYFEYGSSPVFAAADRTYDVYFPYPWSEIDDIQIDLPAGMALDSADAPAEVADPKRIGVDRVQMSIDNAKNILIYRRNFQFGSGGYTLFPKTSYPAIKRMFDAFYEADTHSISLKQTTN